MCHHTVSSGQRMTIVDNCSQASCPVRRLLELKQEYTHALTQRDSFISQNNEKFSVAKFLKDLAEKIEVEDSDVWEAFRKPQNDDRASSYADTRLKTDLERIENTINRNKERVNEKANELIRYFNRRNVQQHLNRYHNQSQNNSASLEEIVNIVLEDLGKSDKGLEYLATLWTEDTVSGLEGIQSVFGFIEQARTLSDELSKFLKHISPALIDEVVRTISSHNFRNVNAVINNSQIQSKLRFLSQKTGVNFQALNTFLTENAQMTSRKFNHLVANSEDLNLLRQRLIRADIDLERVELDDELEKFDGIGNVLKVLSFAIATFKIVSDFKSASDKDKIAFVSTVLNFGKDVGEFFVRGESRLNMVVGLYGSLLGVVVGLMDSVENFQGRDPLLGVLNLIGTAAAYVGIFSGLIVGSAEVMGLSSAAVATAMVVSSACIIIGIIIVILIYIFTDPPFIAFIEDTYYGVDHIININQTIDKFFELSVFEMTLRLEGDAPDKRLVIESRALDDAYPLYLKLNKNSQSMGTVLIDPTSDSYHGKAGIQKYVFWDYDRRRTRQLTINRFWELWDDEESGINVRAQEAHYSLYARLDPDRDGNMEIKASMDPINFPSIQPMVRELTIDNNYRVVRGQGYLKFRTGGRVNITIKTSEAIGYTCQILWSENAGGNWSRQNNTINQNTSHYNFHISSPPQNDTYTLNIVAKLFNNVDSEPVHTYRTNEIEVGTENYLRSQGIT
jgi:hypothetical protein